MPTVRSGFVQRLLQRVIEKRQRQWQDHQHPTGKMIGIDEGPEGMRDELRPPEPVNQRLGLV